MNNRTLEFLKRFFPSINDLFGVLQWKFKQDNAPIHTAAGLKLFLERQNVSLLDWPPYSPDLSIIENFGNGLLERSMNLGNSIRTKSNLLKE